MTTTSRVESTTQNFHSDAEKAENVSAPYGEEKMQKGSDVEVIGGTLTSANDKDHDERELEGDAERNNK